MTVLGGFVVSESSKEIFRRRQILIISRTIINRRKTRRNVIELIAIKRDRGIWEKIWRFCRMDEQVKCTNFESNRSDEIIGGGGRLKRGGGGRRTISSSYLNYSICSTLYIYRYAQLIGRESRERESNLSIRHCSLISVHEIVSLACSLLSLVFAHNGLNMIYNSL